MTIIGFSNSYVLKYTAKLTGNKHWQVHKQTNTKKHTCTQRERKTDRESSVTTSKHIKTTMQTV